ncbi:hypothetical protein ACA135_04750 [Methanobrevibacter acididurans]|jgi:hypothetical protein|uniref:hypothetical protein n=1 Tax=Methanobrevibacter TaxID=2172 RepID=UPI0038FD152F
MSNKYICPYCGKSFWTNGAVTQCPKCGRVFDSVNRPIFDSVGTSYGSSGLAFLKVIGYCILLFLGLLLGPIGLIGAIILCIIIHYGAKKIMN